MTLRDAAYDFSRLRTGIITKRNNTLFFILIIIIPTFFFIFLTFLLLYLFGVPMEIDDVVRTFDEPEYQNFFRGFLSVWGIGVFVNLILIFVTRFQKPSTSVYLMQNADFERVVYVEDKKKRIYIAPDRAITLDPKLPKPVIESHHDSIKNILNEYLFFVRLADREDLKIKNRMRSIRIKSTTKKGFSYEERVYTLRLNDSGELMRYHEMISSGSKLSHQTSGFYRYDVSDVNLNVRPLIDPVIQRLIME